MDHCLRIALYNASGAALNGRSICTVEGVSAQLFICLNGKYVQSSQLIWRSRSLVHERLNYLILSVLCSYLLE